MGVFGNLFTQEKKEESGEAGSGSARQPVSQPVQSNATQPESPSSSSFDPTKRQDLSALTHMDSRSAQVLTHAQTEAMHIKQAFIEPLQLLYGLLFDEEIFALFQTLLVDVAKLSKEIQEKETAGTFEGQPSFSSAAKEVVENSYTMAKSRGSEFITPEDMLMALFSPSLVTAGILQSYGVVKEHVSQSLSKNTEYATGKKSVLDRFGTDLTAKAKEGLLDPIAGRDKEIERAVHILLRRTKNNPILIGEAGVGKTAVVEGLALQIVQGTAPKDLLNKKIVQLEVASLVAGASHRGEFEERLQNVIKEAMSKSGQLILFIDEIHTLIGTGEQEGALDASNIIKPFLARGQVQLIGTTTTAEYRKYFEKDKAFSRRFQPVLVDEPSEKVALTMMQALKGKYEKYHSVVLSDEAMKAAVTLSKKYIGERYLPDKAIDLLDEAAALTHLEITSGKRQDNNVKKTDIEKIVSNWTGIPITRLTEDESQKLLKLEDLIHQKLIDQKEAVSVVSEAVRRGRIGLASANRPIASFIFLGPTGVGKTELAKTLAEILFGRPDAMIRLDMSEYMEKHEVAKLIGAPPGYVGYEEGGQLTEAVRTKPYSIVLLDEVEKAHPDVFNILLQLLEDGRLTDNKGNTISFKNTIIIATSNIGSTLIQQELSLSSGSARQSQSDGIATSSPKASPRNDNDTEEVSKRYAQLQKTLMGELQKFFRPELVNRFDGVVMFKPLRQEDMSAIAKLNIDKTRSLLKEQGFAVQISDAALTQLAKEGYDPVYGARPLRRLIQTALENPIAIKIIDKTFVAGDTIVIDYNAQKSEFVFSKPQAETAVQPSVAPQVLAQPVQPAVSPAPMQNGVQNQPPVWSNSSPLAVRQGNTNGTAVQPQKNGAA